MDQSDQIIEIKKTKPRKIYESFVTSLSVISTIWIFLIMLIIIYDVLMRTLFNTPFSGTAELVRNTIVIIVFLQMTHVLREGRHIRSTLVVDRLSRRGKVLLTVLAGFLGALLFVTMAYVSWEPLVTSIVEKQYEGEGALRVPTFPARLAIVIGSVFMAFQFLIIVYDAIKNKIVYGDEVEKT